MSLVAADPAPAISIPVGITIGLIASSVQSLGLTIQRKSHVLNQEAPEDERRVEHRRPLWLLGFAIFITSNILGSIFQIASLPVVILAPLGAVSLLWNALFARMILGDLFSKFMVLGTLLIVAGAVLIARFGIVPEPTHSLEDLLALFGRDAFVIYFTLLGIALFFILAATHIFEWSLYRRIAADSRALLPCSSSSRASSPIPLTPSRREPTERTPLLANLVDGAPQTGGQPKSSAPPSITSSSMTAAVSPLLKYRSQLNLIAISYASMSGILSGMCLIFAKSGVELLVLTIVGGQNQFWRWESWALVGGLVAFALLQLWYLHKSLILADPTLVCPLAFCFYNISSIANGLIYYDQLSELTPLHLGLVVIGSAVLLAGVWTLSIQTDEEEGGLREGDWIPADEEGVAPAMAPADIVRVAELVTDAHPPPVPPATATAEPELQRTPPPPSADSDYFPPPPHHAPPHHTHHHRTRSHPHQSTLPNLTPTLPRFGQLLPPDSPTRTGTMPTGLGLSIGISAASPGFLAGTRRRSDVPSPHTRRSISDSFGGGAGGGTAAARRRVDSSASLEDDDGETTALMTGASDNSRGKVVLSSEPDEMEAQPTPARRRGWVWRLVPWAASARGRKQ